LHNQNQLLRLLSPEALALIVPKLKTVPITLGQVLGHPQQDIQNVYFPHSGIISYVVEMTDGNMVETGMVGHDGVAGAIQALDDPLSPNKIMVQAPGTASIIDVDELRRAVAESTPLRVMLARHEQFFIAQVQQSVGCNASHLVEPRMCRWLSRMYDLIGPEMPLTQEFLGQMMGVRRTSVSLVAGQLQEVGLIKYRRGHVSITDPERLRGASCECYAAVNSHYLRIFGVAVPTAVAAPATGTQ
jgi:CRP-like cAMP-binding protein